jgi:hypothetical protein
MKFKGKPKLKGSVSKEGISQSDDEARSPRRAHGCSSSISESSAI